MLCATAEGWLCIKISRSEWIVLAITALFLLLCIGWFAESRRRAAPFAIEVARVDAETETSRADPAPAGKININTADAETLTLLPGIGEARAADIIAYREENGPFAHPEDLMRVKGIGQATLERLLDLIVTEDE